MKLIKHSLREAFPFMRPALRPKVLALGRQRGLMPRGRFSGMFTFTKQKEKRWCKTHPTSLWGKNGMGGFWPQCSQGYRKKEKCEIGK